MIRHIAFLSAIALGLVSGSSAFATSGTWNGTNSASWSAPANWTTATPGATTGTTNTDTATFNAAAPTFGTGANPVIVDSGRNLENITFDTTAGAYIIGTTGGNALTLTSGGTIQDAVTMTSGNIETINAPLTLEGNYTIANNSTTAASALQIGGTVTGAANTAVTLTLGGVNANTSNILSGVLSAGSGTGTLAINKTGAGFWDVTGTNSGYTGTTTITAGTLSIGNASALGSGQINFNGGTLANDTSIALANTIGITSAGTISNNSTTLGTTFQINGNVTGANNAAATLTLGGTNVNTGNILAGAISPGTGTGTLALNKTGAGYWDVTGNNTNYVGTTTISGGTLSMGNANALGSGTIALNGGSLAADTSVSLTNNISQGTFGVVNVVSGSNNIATSGYLTFNGTGGTPSVFVDNMTNGATFSVTGPTLLSNNGSNAGDVRFTGPGNVSLTDIYGGGQGNSTIASNLSYYGTGTFTLNGVDNRSGGATNLLGGTTVVNYGAGSDTTQHFQSTGNVFLGSNLILSGGSSDVETIGSLTVASNSGSAYYASVSASAGSGNTISIGSLFGATNSTINFQPSVALTTSASGSVGAYGSGTTGVFGGWALAGNGSTEDFAASLTGTAGTATAIVGLPSYLYQVQLAPGGGQNLDLTPNASGAALSNPNQGNYGVWKIDTSNGTAAGSYAMLRPSAAANFFGSENILYTGNTGANYTISGNPMYQNETSAGGTSSGQIYLDSYGTGSLTISSQIYGGIYITSFSGTFSGISGGNGALTKSGSGTVVLTGANNYVGITAIDQGTLSINSDSNLGGVSGLLTVTNSSTSSTTVTVSSTGFPQSETLVGASFLGSTITGQTNSGGTTITLTLAGNANVTTTSGSYGYANGQQNLLMNGTLQATGNGSFTLGETATGGLGGTVYNYRPIIISVDGATFNVTGTTTLTAPGIISGASGTGVTGDVTLTKTGTGTMILAGADTYTGGTFVNGGTLELSFNTANGALAPATNVLAATGAVSLGGGTLNINGGASAVANTQTIASLALTGGANTISSTLNTASSTTLTVTNGSISRAAGSTIDFISPTGTNVVLSGNANNPYLGTYAFFNTGANQTYAATSSTGLVQAATLTGITAASSLSSATGNYSYTGAGGTDSTISAGTNATANSAVFNTTAAQIVALGTNTLTLNGFQNVGTGSLTISGTGPLKIGSANELVIGGGSNITISAPISGTGGALTDSNTGTLALTGANTYTGTTTVNSGVLSLTGGSLTGSNIVTSAAGAGVVTQTSGNTIAGSGTTFTQASSGTSTLGGTNSYTGLTTVSNGELDLSSGGTAIAGNVAVSGGTLLFKAGSQVATTGSLAVSGGTVNLQTFNQTLAGVQLTGGTLTGTTGILTSSSTYDIQAGAANAILAGTSGSVGLTKSGANTAEVSGNNTYTGTTTISAGTLYASNVVVATGYSNLGNATSAVVLGGTSTTGTLSYTGANATYTRGFTISAGGGEIDASQNGVLTVSTGGISNASGGFTTFGGVGSTTVSSVIGGGSGGLTANLDGTLTLSGLNTYTGATTLNAGVTSVNTLVVTAGASSLGNATSAIAINNNADLSYTGSSILLARGITIGGGVGGEVDAGTLGQTLTLGSAGVSVASGDAVTFGGVGNTAVTSVISGTTVGLYKAGTGSVTLTGANTYTGNTTIAAGTLNASNIVVSGGSSNLGNSTAAVILGGGLLNYTGSSVTYTRGFALTGNSEVDTATAGQTLTIQTGNITGNTLFTTFGGAGNTTVASNITTTTGGVTKLGLGTLILQGANTYTGVTTVDSGTAQVGNGTTGTLSSGDAVTFNGGTLNLNEAAAATQNLGALTFAAGDGVVQSTYGGSGTSTTNFSSLATRTAGATGNFVLSGGTGSNNVVNVSTVGTTGGVSLGYGLFFGGSSYAVNGAAYSLTNGSVSGPVRAINYGTDPGTLASNTSTIASITNPGGTIATATTTATSLASSTTTSGSATVTVSSTTGLLAGQPVSGTGIPAGAVITSVNSGTSITISANATSNNAANDTLTFGTSNTVSVSSTTGLAVGQYVSGTGIPANSYITAIGSGSITISQYATAAGSGALAYTTPFVQTTANVTAQANGSSFTDLNLSGTPNFTLASAATVKVDGILKSGTGSSIISGGTGLTSVNSGDEFVIRADQATDALTISTPILANGANALTKSGAGTVTLSGANTYTGVTTIDGGTLSASTIVVAAGSSNLGNAASAVVLNGGDLSYTGSTATYSRGFTVLAGGGEFDNTTANLVTISGNIVESNEGNMTFGGTGNTTVTSVVSGTGGLNKVNTGTTTLSGTNTYTGPTTVNGGVLAVTGSLATGQTTVGGFSGGATASTLSGTGTIGGALTTSSANGNVGQIAPGANTAGTNFGTTGGTLTVAGAVTIGSGTALDFDLSGSTTTGNDLITMTGGGGVTGLLTIGGATTINLNQITGQTLVTGSTTSNYYTLIGGAGTSNFTGSSFSAVLTGSADTAHVFTNGNNLDVYFTSVTGTSYSLSTVAASSRILTGHTTTLTTTITNSGSAGQDSLSYTGLGSGSTGVSGSTTSSSTPVALGGTGQNTVQIFTGSTTGNQTVTPTVATATNGTIGGSATLSGTPASATVDVVASRTFNTPTAINLNRFLVTSAQTGSTSVSSTGLNNVTENATLGTFSSVNGLSLGLTSGSATFNGATSTQTAGYTLSGTASTTGNFSGSASSTVTSELGDSIAPVTVAISGDAVTTRSFTVGTSPINLGRFLLTSTPGATTSVSSTGLNAVTENATLGSFSAVNGLTLSLTTGSATFNGATSNQTAGYTVGGTASNAGAVSGTFSSTVTSELGDTIAPVTVAVTGNALNLRTITNGAATNFGTLHSGAGVSGTANAFTSTGVNASTTSVQVAGGSGSADSNGVTLTGSSTTFNGATSGAVNGSTQTFGGTISSATGGTTTGSFNLAATTLETGLGDTYAPVAVSYTANVYTGQSTWATNGSGSWGTLSGTTTETFGANWGAGQGSPGLDPNFKGVDKATFTSNGSTPVASSTVNLNAAAPNLNAITFNSPTTSYTIAQGTGGNSITLSGITPSINVLAGGGTHTISAPVILGANTALAVATGQGLTISGQVSGSTYGLSNTGAGATFLSNAAGNTYTGGTTVSLGTLYANNTGSAAYSAPTSDPRTITATSGAGSATGTGGVTVASGGTFAGTGTIAPGAGSGGVVVQSGGTLASGGVQSNASPYNATSGLTINNAAGLTSALSINAGSALQFALGAGTTTGGTGTGFLAFSTPNTNSSFLNIAGNTAGEINFDTAASSSNKITIDLVDLTTTAPFNTTLSLRSQNPYLLVQAGSDSDYDLITSLNGVLSVDGNGYVVGIGSSTTSFNANPFNIEVTALGSNTPINGSNNYQNLQLYLYNGDLEVVPEPGTWVLMLGGLALLVAIQYRRNKYNRLP